MTVLWSISVVLYACLIVATCRVRRRVKAQRRRIEELQRWIEELQRQLKGELL